MGGSASTSDGTSSFVPAMQAQAGLENTFLSGAFGQQPYLYKPNLADITKQGATVAELNALKSRDLQQELTPDITAMQQELSHQVLGDLNTGGELGGGSSPNDVTNVLQRNAVRAGVADALYSGVRNPGSAPAGKEAILRSLGNAAIDWRNQNQAKAAALLEQNPAPSVGLAPGDLQGLDIGSNQNNVNIENAMQGQKLGFANQQVIDMNNSLQNSMAMTSKQAQANANAQNARYGANLGAFTTLAGSAIGGASSAAKFM